MIDQTRRGSHPGASLQDQYHIHPKQGDGSMKTIKINRDTIRITEPEIRGLRAIKAAGFIATKTSKSSPGV